MTERQTGAGETMGKLNKVLKVQAYRFLKMAFGKCFRVNVQYVTELFCFLIFPKFQVVKSIIEEFYFHKSAVCINFPSRPSLI